MLSRLNIRLKIILGLIVPAVCLGLLTAFSYYNLTLVEKKIFSIELIDDIENEILEFRRQEKNFLLYGEKDSYELALREVDATLAMLDQVDTYGADNRLEDNITLLKEHIQRYRAQMNEMFEVALYRGETLEAETEELRDIGKGLVLLAQDISTLERGNLLIINKQLRMQLLVAAVAVGLLFLLIIKVVSVHILKPLKMIERTTNEIALGHFSPLPSGTALDEMGQVQRAFNRMLMELEKRQDQLVQAQKLSSIGTLSAGIAHQLNNPLNNISTSAQILRDELGGDVPPFARKMLDNIDNETARARDTVRGLLDFARHTDLSLRRVSLRQVVKNALRLVTSQVPPGVTLLDDVPGDIQLVLDPQRMSEVLLNLIINAIQAMEQGSGTIRIYQEQDAPPGMVTLVVEDNGKGIAEQDLPHIFDPFFTRKNVGEGTGLGLSVAYGIIEEFKGSIRVASTPGTLTRFYIDLPICGAACEYTGAE